jgi:hypothetical protein
MRPSCAVRYGVDEHHRAAWLSLVRIEPWGQGRTEDLPGILSADQSQRCQVHGEDCVLRRHQHHGFGQVFEQGAQPGLAGAHDVEFDRVAAGGLGPADCVQQGLDMGRQA